jgi:hypothetical protein
MYKFNVNNLIFCNRFVERSILVEGGGCPWTDSTCLPCTTLIVRCIVIILYSLIIIYMDRYSRIMSKYSVIIIYIPYVVWYRLIICDISVADSESDIRDKVLF